MVIPNPTHYWSLSTRGQAEDTAPGASADGTISGTTHTVNGKIRGANLGSSTTSITTTSIPHTDGSGNDEPFSVSCWVYHNTLTSYQSHIGTYGASGNREWYTLVDVNGKIYFSCTTSNGANYIGRTTNDSAITINGWYHILYTYNGSETNGGLKIFVNGSQVDTTNLSAGTYTGMSNTSRATYLMYRGDGYGMVGYVCEVAMFDSDVSSDVSDLYNSGDGVFWNQVTSAWEEQDSLRNGLVSAWNFNGDALDDVGSNDGTVSDATITQSGVSAQAYDFDGNDDGIYLADDSFDDYNEGTVSAWINLSTLGLTGTILGVGSSASTAPAFGLRVSTNNNLEYVYKNDAASGLAYGNGGTALSGSTWYHVVFTSDGSTLKMYLNGSEETVTMGSGSNLGQWFSDIGTTYVHKYSLGFNTSAANKINDFDGLIDEVGVWDRALTSTEVSALYNSGTGKVFDKETQTFIDGDELRIGVVASYSLDENALDNTIQNNDGTVSGATSDTTNEKLGTGCYDFDGTNDIIEFGSIASDIRTISLWVNLNSTTEVIFQESSGSGLSVSSGTLSYSAWDNAYVNAVDTNTVSTGWHHIVLTSTTNVNVSDFILGVLSAAYLDGLVDEVTLWNRALSSTEVSALYNTNTGLAWPYSTTTPPVVDIENAIFFAMNF